MSKLTIIKKKKKYSKRLTKSNLTERLTIITIFFSKKKCDSEFIVIGPILIIYSKCRMKK